IFDYRLQLAAGSMLNTPPTWNWYVAGLTFRWMLEQGGVEEFARRNAAKAAALYAAIDGSGGFYRNGVDPAVRSRMNVPFQLHDPALDAAFLAEAAAAGLVGLKGHRVLGGMRASIYNAMPLEGVQALVAFMADVQRRHGCRARRAARLGGLARRLAVASGPGGPLPGTRRARGAKSFSHRAIMRAALPDGTSTIDGFLEGEDTRATAAIFQAMGVRIDAPASGHRVVHGVGLDGLG